MFSVRSLYILFFAVLAFHELSGQNATVESRYLDQVMRLDFDASQRHAEVLDAELDFPYYSAIAQFMKNAGQYPEEDRELYEQLNKTINPNAQQKPLAGLTRAAFQLYNSTSNDMTFRTLSDVILVGESDDQFHMMKLTYLLMMELHKNEIVQISEDYDKFLKLYKGLAESSVELAWYQVHRIYFITRLLDVKRANKEYPEAIEDIDAHFDKYNLSTELKAHYNFIKGVYHRNNKDTAEALKSFHKAVELSGDRACLRYNKLVSYIQLAGIEAASNNFEKAREYIDLAGDHRNRSDTLRSDYILNRFTAEWYYARTGEFEKAFNAMKNASAAERRLNYRNNSLRISVANVELETAVREKVIEETEGQLQTTTRWLWVIGVLSAVLVAVLVLLGQAARKIKAKNEKIELLMKELHHRVKNNLQVISSLLGLQSMKLKDQSAKDAINEGKDRLKAMALIHQKLYTNQGEEIANLNIKDYLTDLIEELAKSYSKGVKVKLNLQIADLEMDTDTALPLGLIVNEVVSNSFKHAFLNISDPQMDVTLKLVERNVHLNMADNGLGLPDDFDPFKASTFGMRLIQLLTKQLSGKMTFEGNGGARYQLIIPIKL